MSKPNEDRQRIKGNRGGARGNREGHRDKRDGHKDGGHKEGGHKEGGQKRELYRGEERPKKDAILDLTLYQDKEITVKFSGGRQVTGILKGYDQLMNLVLDEVKERLRDPEDENVLLDQTRDLGRVVVRGPLLQSIYPADGAEIIPNPFAQPEPAPII